MIAIVFSLRLLHMDEYAGKLGAAPRWAERGLGLPPSPTSKWNRVWAVALVSYVDESLCPYCVGSHVATARCMYTVDNLMTNPSDSVMGLLDEEIGARGGCCWVFSTVYEI